LTEFLGFPIRTGCYLPRPRLEQGQLGGFRIEGLQTWFDPAVLHISKRNRIELGPMEKLM
jgi:hypothetical protein